MNGPTPSGSLPKAVSADFGRTSVAVALRGSTFGRAPQDDGSAPQLDGFFLPNMPLRLSNSSILAPFFFMMIDCWITDRVLFQAQ